MAGELIVLVAGDHVRGLRDYGMACVGHQL